MTSKEQKIQQYEKAAADSRDLQQRAEAVGSTEIARVAGESVDANLDAINKLKSDN